MDRERIKQRIQNLLALTESDNQHEALSAALAARTLMAKYHISMSGDEKWEEIKGNPASSRVVIKELRFRRTTMKWHHRLLAFILAKNFRCRTFYRYGTVPCVLFMGFEEDAYAVLLLMEYLVRFMERGARAYGGDENQERCWRDGFCVGVSNGFEEQDRENPGYELMQTVPREVEEAYSRKKLRKVPRQGEMGHVPRDEEAFSCGEAWGKRAVRERSIEESGS